MWQHGIHLKIVPLMLMGKFTQQGQCRSPYKPSNENIRILIILWSAAQKYKSFYKCISLMSQVPIHPNNLITKTDHLLIFYSEIHQTLTHFSSTSDQGFQWLKFPSIFITHWFRDTRAAFENLHTSHCQFFWWLTSCI